MNYHLMVCQKPTILDHTLRMGVIQETAYNVKGITFLDAPGGNIRD